MRKLIGLSFLIFIATSAMAQQKMGKPNLVKSSSPKIITEKVEAGFCMSATAAQKKAAGNTMYYTKPAGCPYYGWGQDNNGFGNTMLATAPWTAFTFTDKSQPSATAWFVNNGNEDGDIDISDWIDNGTFRYALDPGYYLGLPIIQNLNGRWQMGQNNTNYEEYPPFISTMTDTDIWPLTFVDDHTGFYTDGGLSTGNLYGTGTLTIKGMGTGTCIGVRQDLPAPLSPIYTESILLRGVNISGTIGTLTMKIYNRDSDSADPVFELTATDADIIQESVQTLARKSSNAIYEILEFKNKTTNANGDEVVTPMIIDFPAEIVVTGMDEADFGPSGLAMQKEDESAFQYTNADGTTGTYVGKLIVKFPDYENLYDVQYNSPSLFLNVYYKGVMDGLLIWDNAFTATEAFQDINTLKISDDGLSCTNPNFGENNYAIIQTVFNWYNEDGTENYHLDAPDWVTGHNVDTLSVLKLLTVTGEPLPSDVAGRGAYAYVRGRGVSYETPIFVYQGDFDASVEWADNETEGIKNVAVEDKKNVKGTYNVAGQKVSDAYKGLIIKDGRKFLNR